MSDWGKGVNNDIGWGQGGTNDIGWGSIYADSNSGLTLLLKDNTAFIIEVKTDEFGISNNDQFQFTGAEGDYDVVAKQGGIIVQTFNNLANEETLTFSNGAGTYTLEVNAKEVDGFTGMRFNDSGDKEKITKNLQWGVFNDTRQQLFFGCSNLTEIGSDVNWLNSITNGTQIFSGCSLTSLPNTLTLNSLENGSAMFNGNSLTSLPPLMTLNNLQTGSFMFLSNSLTSLNNVITLENVVDTISMFRDNVITLLPETLTLNNLEDGNSMFSVNLLTDLPAAVTLPNLENGTNFLNANTINTARYSTLLEDMENGNSNTNVPFNGGLSKYNTNGETARDLLIANQNWSFTDGGLV